MHQLLTVGLVTDAECGTCKIPARNREMEHTELKPTRIRTAEELKDFCKKKLTSPQRNLKQKHGRGIFKRCFHYVPASGPLKTLESIKVGATLTNSSSGVVNRRIRKGTTVKGSSKFHVFADIGIAGHLVWRKRGCHSPNCGACWQRKYKECTKIPRDSLRLARAGLPRLPQSRQITLDGLAEHIVPMTRNVLCQRGVNLAAGLEGEL